MENAVPEVIARLQALLPDLASRYRVRSLRVFGSFARREQRRGSDLDILVSFEEAPGLLRFVELEDLLSQSLGLPVDLVMADALKPGIAERIAPDLVAV
jgi:predicted nucleotidyltransferase